MYNEKTDADLKMYYSIGEIADMLNVAPSCIRFWEEMFHLDIKKSKKGNRQFRPADVEVMREVHRLVKIEGYTLEGAKRKFAQKSPGWPHQSFDK